MATPPGFGSLDLKLTSLVNTTLRKEVPKINATVNEAQAVLTTCKETLNKVRDITGENDIVSESALRHVVADLYGRMYASKLELVNVMDVIRYVETVVPQGNHDSTEIHGMQRNNHRAAFVGKCIYEDPVFKDALIARITSFTDVNQPGTVRLAFLAIGDQILTSTYKCIQTVAYDNIGFRENVAVPLITAYILHRAYASFGLFFDERNRFHKEYFDNFSEQDKVNSLRDDLKRHQYAFDIKEMLLSLHLKSPFMTTLECDVRGVCTLFHGDTRYIYIELGEIKSLPTCRNLVKAAWQLLLRLYFMATVVGYIWDGPLQCAGRIFTYYKKKEVMQTTTYTEQKQALQDKINSTLSITCRLIKLFFSHPHGSNRVHFSLAHEFVNE